MSNKNQTRLSDKRLSPKDRHMVKILSGILCLAVGLYLNWDIAAPTDIPEWVNTGPIIDISAEKARANIDVRCDVMESGIFTLNLSAGARLSEPVRVWIFVSDPFYAFNWEIMNSSVDNVVLAYADSVEETANDYPIERTFISERTGCMNGESRGYLSDWLHAEAFTTVITPEEGDRKIKFQMEPEHVEYRTAGDIIIRMPYVINARNMPVYDMSMSDVNAMFESGDYNILPYFSNCMVDKAPLFETALNICGDYYSEYIVHHNYIMTSIQPNPVQLLPSYRWVESLQWIPYIIFHDLNYDRNSLICTWVGGILIAVGSGLLVLPLPDWIQSMEKSRR